MTGTSGVKDSSALMSVYLDMSPAGSVDADAVSASHVSDKGKQFGKWTVIDPFVGKGSGGIRLALVRCECGTERVVGFTYLKHGKSRQCRRCANRDRSPENRRQLLQWARSARNKERLAELARRPENRSRMAELARRPETLARKLEWANSEENLSRLRSAERRAVAAEVGRRTAAETIVPESRSAGGRERRRLMVAGNQQWAEQHCVPRAGSLLEPVYACQDCGLDGKILAFRTKEEETAHFAGYPHSRGKRAVSGILVAPFFGPLAGASGS